MTDNPKLQAPTVRSIDPKDCVRLSVNVSPETARAISALAQNQGLTVSELVHNALATGSTLGEAKEDGA